MVYVIEVILARLCFKERAHVLHGGNGYDDGNSRN